MPETLRMVAAILPLSHAIDIARPLLAGRIPGDVVLHLLVLLGYAFVTYYTALVLTRRRLLK
jgi:lipooligosaccharide transport system permease protein